MWVFMPLLLLLLHPASVPTASFVNGVAGAFVGMNIGTQVSDMPPPESVVRLLQFQGIRHVRLYDADRDMLLALANTHIEVLVSVPNNQILAIGQSNITAANWVKKNVAAYLPNTNITGIVVGNEVITSLPNVALVLVSAMRFLHSALVAANLDQQVRVSTSHSMDIMVDPFPPSQAYFNQSYSYVIRPMLEFLHQTKSYFMLNAYPYYIFMQGNGKVPLDYALFQPLSPDREAVDPNTLLHYTNVLDAILDAAIFSMMNLNFSDIQVVVSETGWPSKGGAKEPQATVDNAVSYISNLVRHVLNSTGTPKRPQVAVNTYIYELYNEDLRAGPVSEQNWGLFYPNGTPVYFLHLTGAGEFLANDTTNQTFCIAKPGADPKLLQAALDWACGPGAANCTPIQGGEECYNPDTVQFHASYAFDSYYQSVGKAPDSCDFKGVAIITTTDPSYDSCFYPGRYVKLESYFSSGFYPGSAKAKNASALSNETSVSGTAIISNRLMSSVFYTIMMWLSLF